MEQIYVLELIVYQIDLYSNYKLNDVSELVLSFKFAQRINFDIDTHFFTVPEVQAITNGHKINMNYGKTFLFTSKPSVLRQLLQSDPFCITLYDGNVTVGQTQIPWKKEFAEMVKFFETLGIVKSTTLEGWHELKHNGQLTAKVNLFIRMSCFGSNVQTMFHIEREGSKHNYIFRQRNESKIFKVEKHADDRVQPLVAPLYSGITDGKSKTNSQINLRENVSLTELFAGAMDDKISVYQGVEDAVSICYRPSDNKFYNLLTLLSADVKTHDKGTCVTIQKSHTMKGDHWARNGPIESPEVYNFRALTGDKIAGKLCGNDDCPAVKKFKDYGIGHLATGKNLGTLYTNDVEPSVTYGMSHTYGTFREYGPYGVFARPKDETLPFVPFEKEEPEISSKPCRLKSLKSKNCTWHSRGCPLRLRGGSDQRFLEKPDETPDSEGVLVPNSPMVECKSVMDQFDNILAEYKKAVGPCGQATCPFAQTLAEDACKKACEITGPLPVKETSLVSCNDVPCDMAECPYGETKKKRYPAGCGSPKCAYTKYKLGLLDDDAELELQFLPPALGVNCGEPQCKYPLEPPLPPIHWDCPDPLPKGPCRNLNCPFLPPPLKKFKTKSLKTGPCGSPTCPYAIPSPCAIPTCPFAMKPCPMMTKKQSEKVRCDEISSDEESICKNPECPFSEKTSSKEIEDELDDPNVKGEFQECDNPDCPHKKKEKIKPPKKKKKKKTEACDNPDCTYNQDESTQKSKKKKKKKTQCDEESVCSNPECDYVKMKQKKAKPRLESGSSSDSICSDPECPYAEYKKIKKEEKTKTSGEACPQPGEGSLCSNEECPERMKRMKNDQEGKVCSDPYCPYSKKPPKSFPCSDPRCPYLQPLPSCGVPNCPYEPIPIRISCKNPVCPSKSINFSKSSGKFLQKQDDQRQANKEANALAPIEEINTTTVCEETVNCEQKDPCENPDCEMNDSEGDNGGPVTNSDAKKKNKRKKKGKFVYSMGDNYPDSKVGHKECMVPVFTVPANMGWLWNIYTPVLGLKPRRGWRPGALTKTIAQRIRAHRQAKGLGLLTLPNFRQGGIRSDDEPDRKVVPRPTLQIQKRENCYWITMNPLKDPASLAENEDPYMECTPMTFKITKNKKQEDYCVCDCEEPTEELSSSSDSELDIEFTPPAGIIHPERFKKKPNVVSCESQYDPQDFVVEKKHKEEKKGKEKKGKDKKGKGDKKGGKKKKGK